MVLKDKARQWLIGGVAVLVVLICAAIIFSVWQRGKTLPRPAAPDVSHMQRGMMEQMQRMPGVGGQ